MIKIYIVWDSFKHFQTPIDEYLKRFWKKVKIIKIKPSKSWTKEQIIEKDTKNLNKILQKSQDFNVLLSLNWTQFSSEEIAYKIISKNLNLWKPISFFIWWAFWLDEEKLVNVDLKISLWKITLPHWLALLILLEQIYRSFQILEGKDYHY